MRCAQHPPGFLWFGFVWSQRVAGGHVQRCNPKDCAPKACSLLGLQWVRFLACHKQQTALGLNSRSTHFVCVPCLVGWLCSEGGAKGKGKTCTACDGQGVRVQLRQIGIGMVQQVRAQCERCNGSGQYPLPSTISSPPVFFFLLFCHQACVIL